MKTFTVILAQDVSAWGTVSVEAETFEDAVRQIHADLRAPMPELWVDVYEVEWNGTTNDRICKITDDESGETVDDIPMTDPENGQRWVRETDKSIEDILEEVRVARL